jgi:hypothetical protein
MPVLGGKTERKCPTLETDNPFAPGLRPIKMIKALFLFCRDYGILKSLGHPHFNNGLSRNFERFAGLRIPTGAGFAFGKDKFADTGKSKRPGLLGFTDVQVGQFIHDGVGRAFG